MPLIGFLFACSAVTRSTSVSIENAVERVEKKVSLSVEVGMRGGTFPIYALHLNESMESEKKKNHE